VTRPREAALRSAGANDWYTFAGTAKATEVVRATTVGASPIEVDLDVYSPKGEALCAARAGVTAQVACALPVSGTYSVRVHDGADDETGVYALTIRPDCTITGTSGADTLKGTSGNDVICALGGADKVDGGAGDDIIVGGKGNDALDGGTGNDVFLSERTSDGADVVAGGTGTDVLSYVERGNAISVTPNVKADDGEAKEHDDVRADVETIIGGGGNDQLVGSAINNTLLGEFGYDALDGGAGTDRCDVGADGGRVTACE
jgi:Ca2+-binding RTX toxin-like protein